MSEPKFNIRPFDANSKPKRKRTPAPAVRISTTTDGWNSRSSMEHYVGMLRQALGNSTPSADNLDDPVINRALLTIHFALIRIETRLFRMKVERVLREAENAKPSGDQ